MTAIERCLIIAEAGVNHNGRLDIALDLCDAAKEAGADVVKFQTWNTDKIITKTVAQADYQSANTGRSVSQYEMLKELELSYSDFESIKLHCDDIGITFASTADEEDSLDFLTSLGIPFVKIGSGDIGNVPFLRHVGQTGLPVILSTGMSDMGEVGLSIAALREGGASDITLLHCTTSYPCAIESVNMRAMNSLRDGFRLPVGYSDHTIGCEAAVCAVAFGATVIEKHFTLDRDMPGPDHVASTDPRGFKAFVHAIRNAEACLGSGVKAPTNEEKEISRVVTKRIVALRDISAGEELTEENVCVKRSNDGMPAKYWDLIVGSRASRSYSENEGVVICV